MGFRIRKTIRILPGVRLNLSKTGIGYSVGVKGYRVTQRADGRVQRTASLPGTGISHVTTTGSARRSAARSGAAARSGGAARSGTAAAAARRPAPPALAPAAHVAKPGLFAPKGEKELYGAVQAKDLPTIERIAQEHPELAVAASSIAAWFQLSSGDVARARQLLIWVFATGKDPAADPFVAKYLHPQLSLRVVEGVRAEVTLDRTGVGLALAELHQAAGDLAAAVEVVEQLEPTSITALSLAELQIDLGHYAEVVDLTNEITNVDDCTALLCTFRGVALREQGHLDAAREVLNSALSSKKREPVIRHRALLERARVYEAEGKRALARKDLERILADDASYPGLTEELAALGS